MDRSTLREHREAAERRLAESEEQIRRQHGIIMEATRDGVAIDESVRALESMQQNRIRVALELQRIQDELSALPNERE